MRGWLTVAATMIVVSPALSQIVNDTQARNIGHIAGQVRWGVMHCGFTETDSFSLAASMAARSKPDAFRDGVRYGLQQGFDSEKQNGRQATCITIRGGYGPGGFHLPDLIK